MTHIEDLYSCEPGSDKKRELYIAGLANSIDAAWLSAKRNGTQRKFLDKADIFAGSTKPVLLPELLLGPRETVQERRQPGLIEAIGETTKRLRFVENLTESLP